MIQQRLEFEDPFRGLDAGAIYSLLAGPDRSNGNLPRWPSEQLQRGYTGGFGPFLVTRAKAFISMLEADGAFVANWKALDYGCGWGRIASLMLAKGGPEQLDMCDAWKKTLSILSSLNFRNKRWLVSESLSKGEIPANTYDFVFAFSVFTHLLPGVFLNNIEILAGGLKKGGSLYFTVRHDEFLAHKYPLISGEAKRKLESDGIWFTPTKGDMGGSQAFGDTVVTGEFMTNLGKEFGSVRYLGRPHEREFQHLYSLTTK